MAVCLLYATEKILLSNNTVHCSIQDLSADAEHST
jgi:hypothetical protein